MLSTKRDRWGWGKMFRSVEHFLIFALQCFRSILYCFDLKFVNPCLVSEIFGYVFIPSIILRFLSHAHKHMLILFLSFTCLLLIFLSFLSYPSLSLSDWYYIVFHLFCWAVASNLCKWVDKCVEVG